MCPMHLAQRQLRVYHAAALLKDDLDFESESHQQEYYYNLTLTNQFRDGDVDHRAQNLALMLS